MEGTEDLRIHVDGQLPLLHDFVIPRLHVLKHPVRERFANKCVHQVDHPLTRKFAALIWFWKIALSLRIVGCLGEELFHPKPFILRN